MFDELIKTLRDVADGLEKMGVDFLQRKTMRDAANAIEYLQRRDADTSEAVKALNEWTAEIKRNRLAGNGEI